MQYNWYDIDSGGDLSVFSSGPSGDDRVPYVSCAQREHGACDPGGEPPVCTGRGAKGREGG